LITLSGCQERNFLAIATEDGIYIGLRDNLDRSVRVLRLPNVVHMTALTSHDRFVLIFEKTLLSFSLNLLASVALGRAPSKQLEQTRDMLASQHKGHVAFFRVGSIGNQDYRTYIRYSFTPGGMSY
jgi:lipoprotein NlpI